MTWLLKRLTQIVLARLSQVILMLGNLGSRKKDKSLKEKMGSKQSVTLSPDESQEVANRTGFSIAQVNKLYHRYFVELIQKIKDQI